MLEETKMTCGNEGDYFVRHVVKEKIPLREFQRFSRPVSNQDSPVGWGCRIRRRHLFRGVKPQPNECPEYITKPSDG